MKDTKRRFESFSFYDHTGIERHLEKMAEQGWLLEKAGWQWTYRRIEPRKLTFCVCYFPKASQYDPEPSEEQETFYEFCRHSGWTLAAEAAQMQIFYNEREHPVPIETDPALEVETIHRSAKKSTLFSHFFLLGTGILETALIIWLYFHNPIDFWSNSALLFSCPIWVIVLLSSSRELIDYFSWYVRAKRAAEQGEFLGTKSHALFQRALTAALLVNLVLWLASMAYSAQMLAISIVSLLLVAAVVVLVRLITQMLKRRKTPARTNRNLTLLSSVILSAVLVGGMSYGLFSTLSHGPLGSTEEVFEHNGQTVTVRRDELPLTVYDLLGLDHDNYTRERDDYRSFFLTKLQFRQYPRLIDRTLPDLPRIEYTVILVHAPFLYDLCRDTLLKEYEDDWYWDRYYAPIDPGPWGAAEAYQVTDKEYGPWNVYLLCFPDRFVTIEFDWEPTPEQMAVVGERLGR